MVEEAEPILLNGYMQRCVYSVDRFGDLCRVGFDLRYLFGVLSASGALCCHSGINELDGKTARPLHTSKTTA